MSKKFIGGGFPGIIPCENIIPTKQSREAHAFSVPKIVPLNKILIRRTNPIKKVNSEKFNIREQIKYDFIPKITHNSYITDTEDINLINKPINRSMKPQKKKSNLKKI